MTARSSAVFLRLLALVLLAAALGGCVLWPFGGGKDEERTEEIDTTEQLLYRDIQRAMRAGNYPRAIEGLQQMEALFPFGRYAEQAQLEIVYAQYMSFNLESARASADRFIRLHPTHSNVDYAYYLKGLAAFNKNRGILDRIFATKLSKRDVTYARESYTDFAQLLARFPNSEYAPDARKRMVYLRNLLAEAEVSIANFYMRRGAYVAASNRARFVVENYGKTEAADDALAILIEASWKLGLEDTADDALQVLALNYPDYPAFDDDGNLVLAEQVRNRDRSWANLISFGILDRPDVPPPLKIQQPHEDGGTADGD